MRAFIATADKCRLVPPGLTVCLPQGAFHRAEPYSRSPYSVCFITQNVWHMGSSSERLSFPTPGVRPFALLTSERPSSSTFTFVGFSRAEEVLCVCRHPPVRQFQIARLRFVRVWQPLLLHSCDQVPRGQRAPLGQWNGESLLSSHDKPWCCSSKHQAHNTLVLPPASTYRCKCHVTIVDTNCPLIPISMSGFTSSTFPVGSSRFFPSRLASSSLPVDSSRSFTSRLASREPRLRLKPSVVFSGCPSWASLRPSAFCKSCDVSRLAFHDSAAVSSALNQSSSQVTVLSMPSLVGGHMHCITCTAVGSVPLTISPCTFLCVDNQLTHLSRCCFAPLGRFIVCTQILA